MIVEALDELSHADYSGSGEGDSGPQEGDGVAGEAPPRLTVSQWADRTGGCPREQRGARPVDHLPGEYQRG